MGLVFGVVSFTEPNVGYDFIKKYYESNGIELVDDDPDNKFISTRATQNLIAKNERGITIERVGNQISGMDREEFEISLEGIPYPFYEE
ncbi:MAG: hypothetical protein ACI8YQ_000394 [Polaribacter sp.]|jgi:hypothetical protein